MNDSLGPQPFYDEGLNYNRVDITFPNLYAAFELHLQSECDFELNDDDPSSVTDKLEICLRHASSKVAHIGGQPTCRLPTHPIVQIASPLAGDGVHGEGSCSDDVTPCVIHEAYGSGTDVSGKVVGKEIHTTPEWDPWSKQTVSSAREVSPSSEGVSGHSITLIWRLTLDHDLAMLGLFAEGIEYLDSHASEYHIQFGDGSEINSTVRRASLLNPLYSPIERLRSLDSESPTAAMRRKDEEWKQVLRPASVEALQDRLSGSEGLQPSIRRTSSADDRPDDDVDENGHSVNRSRESWAMSYWG